MWLLSRSHSSPHFFVWCLLVFSLLRSWSWPGNRSSARYSTRMSHFLRMLLEDRGGFVGGATSEDAQVCPSRTFAPQPVALTPLSSRLFLHSHPTWEWTKTREGEEARKGVEEVPNLIPTVWGRRFGLEKVQFLCEGWFIFKKKKDATSSDSLRSKKTK